MRFLVDHPSRFLVALRILLFACGGTGAGAAGLDDVADRLGERLTFGSADGAFGMRISGRLDLAVHQVSQPSADLLYTGPEAETLFSPVLRIFADARLGTRFSTTGQVRLDRGFDPADESVQVRVEEATLRYTPWPERRVSWQVGRFATVFGSWARRHAAWDYPFITAPLAQEQLTGVWYTRNPRQLTTLFRWSHTNPVGDSAALVSDERNRVPIMWGPVYATGTALTIGGRRWELAMEVKNAGLASNPGSWSEMGDSMWASPALAARLGWRPTVPWNLGASVSRSVYLKANPEFISPGHDREDSVQTAVGVDFSYAWRHWQVWGEVIGARFVVPAVGDADTLSYTLETSYRFSPRWVGFLRWSHQLYAPIQLSGGGGEITWGRDAWRIEAGPALRVAAHSQVKAQVGLLQERPAAENWIPSAAVQWSLRF